MTKQHRPLNGSDAAGAGALLLAVNAISAGVGATLGRVLGAVVPLLLAGFFIGFVVGIADVAKRFRHLI